VSYEGGLAIICGKRLGGNVVWSVFGINPFMARIQPLHVDRGYTREHRVHKLLHTESLQMRRFATTYVERLGEAKKCSYIYGVNEVNVNHI